MRIAYCDRCGEEIRDVSVFEDALVKGETPHLSVVYDNVALDLCRGCKIELARVIESWDNS